MRKQQSKSKCLLYPVLRKLRTVCMYHTIMVLLFDHTHTAIHVQHTCTGPKLTLGYGCGC